MDRSKLSNLVATTRLLQHFSSITLNAVKSIIYAELGCQNESQFLCKVLPLVYKTLSNESMITIKNKVIEMADSQQKYNNETMTRSIGTAANNCNVTIYNYIQQQYTDPLSKLHGDIIDYLGAFLNKKQSIEFGYLNRQLYIETQKQSYLLKRCKDSQLYLWCRKLRQMSVDNVDGFNYTFPTNLSLDFGENDYNTVKNLISFENFFRRIEYLHCYNFFSLQSVPWKLVLNKNSNYYPNDVSRCNFKTLKITGSSHDETEMQSTIDCVDAICLGHNSNNYNDNTDNDDTDIRKLILENTRCIQRLELVRPKQYDSNKRCCSNLVHKQVLLKFGIICASISLCNVEIMIEKADELKSIFHCCMTHIQLKSLPFIDFSKGLATASNDDINRDNSHHSKSNTWIKSITIEPQSQNITSIMQTLTNLDKCFLRRNVELYTIYWNQRQHLDIKNGSLTDLLDKILCKDCEKHQLLQEIVIKLTDNAFLFGLAKLLLYFNEHHKELFVEQKLNLPHLKRITIEYVKIHLTKVSTKMEDVRSKKTTRIQLNHRGLLGINSYSHTPLSDYNNTKEYSIDKSVIRFNKVNVKKSIAYFGVMYQNLLHWLHARQGRSWSPKNGSLDGKIVIVF